MPTSRLLPSSVFRTVHSSDATARAQLWSRQDPHCHPWHELVCLCAGGYDVDVDGVVVHGTAGDLFFYPAGQAHLPKARSHDLRVIGMTWTGEIPTAFTGLRRWQRDGRGRVLMLLTWLWEHSLAQGENWRDATARHLSQLVIEEYRRLAHGEDLGLAAKVDRYLSDNLHFPIDLDEIARAFEMSVSHLVKRYRGETGTTPTRRLQALRAERAVALLTTTNGGVNAIARAVGLASSAHLNVLLKRHAGNNASTIRKVARGADNGTCHTEPV